MSKSILGLKLTIPIIIGAILIRNADNLIKIGKVFVKKRPLSQQIDNLAIFRIDLSQNEVIYL